MKLPNSYGGVSKLSGKRRRPYWVRLTTGWSINEKTGKAKQEYKTLGYYPTRKEALMALAEYHANPMDLTKRDITFKEVFEIWSPKLFEKHPKMAGGILPAFKKCESLHNMKMIDIKTAHIQRILDEYADTSETTQNNLKSVISRSFVYCIENDIVQKNYAEFAKITRKDVDVSDKFFTSEEIGHIFNNLDYMISFPRGKKDRFDMNLTDSIVILLHSGLRIGELLGVKTSDVHLDEGWIHVEGTKTKNAKRVLPIHKDIIEIIKRNMFGEYLISYPDGGQIQYQTYLRQFYKHYMKFLGFEDITPHATRHTFISCADKANINRTALQKIVGHANSSITEHYTHKELADLIAEMNKIVVANVSRTD